MEGQECAAKDGIFQKSETFSSPKTIDFGYFFSSEFLIGPSALPLSASLNRLYDSHRLVLTSDLSSQHRLRRGLT